MNAKQLILRVFIIALCSVSISCIDDFVDIDPQYSLDSESFFVTEQDYYDALIGAYDLLQTTYLNSMLGEIASDNTLCGGENATDVIGFQQIDDMIHTPINDNLQDLWNWMFAGVQRASYLIEFQDSIDFSDKAQIIAEAQFLRAYYNFELVKWFGPIPISPDKRFGVGDEQSLPRSTITEVYAYIEADLVAAIPYLSMTAPQVGRVSLGAAQALLGKAYIYHAAQLDGNKQSQKFQAAADVLDQVIDSGNYDLLTNYAQIFERNGENSIESVFEVQYTDAEGASFDCFQCSEGNIAVGFNGIRQYNGPFYDSGFSFNVPTEEAYNAFSPSDNRRDVAILDIVSWAATYNATYGTGFEHTGYFNKKYIARKGDSNIGDQNLTNPNNYRAIRFADVLLLAAEAHQITGNEASALAYLNRVRRRAFGSSYQNINISGNILLEAIYQERRLELVGEGHRFFDLVRTGEAAEKIDGFQENKNELFPIPLEEIQFSNGNWNQNPGYN